MSNYRDFGTNKFKYLRFMNGLHQTRVLKKLKMSPNNLVELERNEEFIKTFSLNKIIAMAELYNVTVGDMLSDLDVNLNESLNDE